MTIKSQMLSQNIIKPNEEVAEIAFFILGAYEKEDVKLTKIAYAVLYI